MAPQGPPKNPYYFQEPKEKAVLAKGGFAESSVAPEKTKIVPEYGPSSAFGTQRATAGKGTHFAKKPFRNPLFFARWTFRIFFIFFLFWGGGKGGGVRGGGQGGAGFLTKNRGREGVSEEEAREGEGRRGNFYGERGGELNIFYRDRNAHQVWFLTCGTAHGEISPDFQFSDGHRTRLALGKGCRRTSERFVPS